MFVVAEVASQIGAAGTVVGPANVLYVDNVSGFDSGGLIGLRGNYARPFLTIQAAIDASQTGDVVQLAPQNFTITASLTVPTLVTQLTLQGWAEGQAIAVTTPPGVTTLTGATGIDVVKLGTNLGLTRFSLRNLCIDFLNADALEADGVLYAANGFLANGLWVDNVEFVQRGTGFAINLRYVRSTRFVNCYGTSALGGAISCVSCNGVEFDHCQFPASAALFSYDGADPLRTTTQMLVRLRASRLGGTGGDRGVTLTGQPRFEGDAASLVGFIFGLNLAIAGGFAPSIRFYGQAGTPGTAIAYDFRTATRELPDTATALTVDLCGSRFFGTATFAVAGAGANTQTVRMDGSIAMNAATSIVAGLSILLRGIGAVWPAAVMTTPTAGSATIAPPAFVAVLADLSATQTLAFGFNMPASNSYHVALDCDTIGSLPMVVAAGDRDQGQLIITATANAGEVRALITYFGNP